MLAGTGFSTHGLRWALDGINLHRLQVFRTVIEQGSVSAAARHMRLAQPTVSRHLAVFEDEIGVKLFRNVSRRLEPTWEAQRLYAESTGLFERLGQVENSIESIRRGTSEALRIMITSAMSLSILPKAVGRLYRALPDLDIVIESGIQRSQMIALREGSIDIALGSLEENRPDLQQIVLGTVPLVAILPREHPLADRTSFELAWLENMDCALHSPHAPMGSQISNLLSARGIKPRRSVLALTIPLAIGLVRSGGFCALTDICSARSMGGEDVAILDLAEPAELVTAITALANRSLRNSEILFCEEMKRAFSEEMGIGS